MGSGIQAYGAQLCRPIAMTLSEALTIAIIVLKETSSAHGAAARRGEAEHKDVMPLWDAEKVLDNLRRVIEDDMPDPGY